MDSDKQNLKKEEERKQNQLTFTAFNKKKIKKRHGNLFLIFSFPLLKMKDSGRAEWDFVHEIVLLHKHEYLLLQCPSQFTQEAGLGGWHNSDKPLQAFWPVHKNAQGTGCLCVFRMEFITCSGWQRERWMDNIEESTSRPCPYHSCCCWLLAEKTGTGAPLSHPSCPPNDPTGWGTQVQFNYGISAFSHFNIQTSEKLRSVWLKTM